MNPEINIDEIIELVKQQAPEKFILIESLQNCPKGIWESKAYLRFVNSKNANQIGAEWQFSDNIILEHPTMGTIVLDVLENNKIGGIEFLNQLE